MTANTLETAAGLTGIFSIVAIFVIVCLAIAAIIMPVVVICIDRRVMRIRETLAAMEDMMRNGK